MKTRLDSVNLVFNGHWVSVNVEVGDGWISPQDGYYDDDWTALTDGELDQIAARQDQLDLALHGLGGNKRGAK